MEEAEAAAAAAACACACAAVGEGAALPLLLPPSPPLPMTTRSDIEGALLHSSRALDRDEETRLIGRGRGALPVGIAAAEEGEGIAECGEVLPAAKGDDDDAGENAAPFPPPLTGVGASEEEAEAFAEEVDVITLNPAVVVIAAMGETDDE